MRVTRLSHVGNRRDTSIGWHRTVTRTAGGTVDGRRSAVPDRSPVRQYLDRLYRDHHGIASGDVATYIPQLGTADPSWFAVAIATMDGEVYATGDCDLPFTIQSISKPFVYGMALDDRGTDYVLDRVGVEPTGDPFNSIAVDEESN